MHALKGLALRRASHSGEIVLAGSRRLRSTLAAAPVLFAHAAVTETKIGRIFPKLVEYSALFECFGFAVVGTTLTTACTCN